MHAVRTEMMVGDNSSLQYSTSQFDMRAGGHYAPNEPRALALSSYQ